MAVNATFFAARDIRDNKLFNGKPKATACNNFGVAEPENQFSLRFHHTAHHLPLKSFERRQTKQNHHPNVAAAPNATGRCYEVCVDYS
jgi:hypothetical protein